MTEGRRDLSKGGTVLPPPFGLSIDGNVVTFSLPLEGMWFDQLESGQDEMNFPMLRGALEVFDRLAG